MIKCIQCSGDVSDLNGIVVSVDGDFVCSKKCHLLHEKAKEHFFSVVIHDDQEFDKWMKDAP